LKARGFRPATSRHTLATLGLVVGTVLVRALERSERVAEAMRCRGFSGHFALLPQTPLTATDGAVLAGALAAAVAIVAGAGPW
ncbi:cobalt ECF transporter T component CbiQ, partial [Mycobacterium tuberculosis]|nr:cobalt ECF transporter T component CbiQ [Mycobacterium tuberculosis]